MQLLAAANYEGFQQRQEINLVNSSDIIVSQDESEGPPPV
jgi:hypothetical protein